MDVKGLLYHFFLESTSNFLDSRTSKVVEMGGCEDDFRQLVRTHPALVVPEFTASYLCEVGFALFYLW